LFKFLAYVIAFLLAAYLFDSRKRRSLLLGVLIVLGCFEAGWGIVQYLTGWHKIFTYTNIFDLFDATGTYINRNHFAGLLELIMPFVLAAAFYSFQKASAFGHGNGSRGAASRGAANFQAFFYLFVLAIMFVALVFSRSRGGILAATFSLVFIALLGQIKVARKGWLLFVVLFLTLIVGYGLWIGLNPVLERFEQIGQKNFLQEEARTEIWKDTLGLVRTYPVTGTGLGTFGIAYRRYQTVAVEKYVDHAHNDYLELTADTGWVGLALLFLPILYLFFRMMVSFLNDSHRYRRSILLGCIGSTLALLAHSFIDFNLHIPANALIFAVVLGIGYKASCVERRREAHGAEHQAGSILPAPHGQ
jgi:O-antigen ligase